MSKEFQGRLQVSSDFDGYLYITDAAGDLIDVLEELEEMHWKKVKITVEQLREDE